MRPGGLPASSPAMPRSTPLQRPRRHLRRTTCRVPARDLRRPPSRLSAGSPAANVPDLREALTRRESEVLRLLGPRLLEQGDRSELFLSVATVKHHVHHILAS